MTFYTSQCVYINTLYIDIYSNHECDDRLKLNFQFSANFNTDSVFTAIDLATLSYMIDASYNMTLLPSNAADIYLLEYTNNDLGLDFVKNLTESRLAQPIPMRVGRNLFTVKLRDAATNMAVTVNSKGWSFTLMYASDFCSNTDCVAVTNNWLAETERLQTLYCTQDVFAYEDKYGFCQGKNTSLSYLIAGGI